MTINERKVFEQQFCRFPFDFFKERDAEGDYKTECMRHRWEGWKGRADLDKQQEVTDEMVRTLCKLAKHADDCLSYQPLPTGEGNWHCSCGYDSYILDGEPHPSILSTSPQPQQAVPDGWKIRREESDIFPVRIEAPDGSVWYPECSQASARLALAMLSAAPTYNSKKEG